MQRYLNISFSERTFEEEMVEQNTFFKSILHVCLPSEKECKPQPSVWSGMSAGHKCKLPGMSWSQKISSGMLKLQHASYESLLDKFLHGPLRLNIWWKNEHVETSEVLARSDYVRPVTTDTASSFPLQPKPPKLHLADKFSSPGVPDPLNPSLLSGDGWSNICGCNGAKMKLGCLLNLLITIILHTLSSAQTIIVPAVYLHWNEYFLNKFKQTAWVYYAFYIPN